MIIRYFLIGCLAFFLLGFAHPFYVSICQIDYNPDENSLELTFKIFTDDLEKALEAQGTGKLYLGSEKEPKDANRFIFNYLKKKFQVSINDRNVPLNFLGKEVELDVTWCYIEISSVSKIEKIKITNSILLEQFDTQSNIVHVRIGDQKKSLLLHRAKTEGSLTF